jgi:hypothetical protein
LVTAFASALASLAIIVALALYFAAVPAAQEWLAARRHESAPAAAKPRSGA